MPGILDKIDAGGLSAVHILLAICVTIHVLFHKRDIGASVGWIGLAWLSPIFGSILYFIFGINRVKRRASQLREGRPVLPEAASPVMSAGRDDHLASLERAGDVITQNEAERGNLVAILHNGGEAYPKMIAAIEAAEVSIALSSYIFRADDTGNKFIEALIRARRRGADVRVLIDGIGGGYFLSPAYKRLRRNGVPACRFMHSTLPWRMPFLNLRTHKKILILDGRIAFTGGLNIGDENVLANLPRHPVRDTHLRFEGPVVAQLSRAFAADWLLAAGEALAGGKWFPSLDKIGDAVARVILSGPDEDIEKIEFMILEAIACARQSIKVMTPYFLPGERMITALALASMRGVKVDIIVPTRSNHLIIDWAMRPQIGPLVSAGCQIWRSPQPFDHSKIMTVDGIWCLIGGANWDVRSFRLNFELDMEIYHSEIAQHLDALMAATRATPITAAELDSLPLALKLIDNGARLLLPYL